MPVVLVAEQTLTVGTATVIEAPSPITRFGVVFEDDASTGYFYGQDFAKGDNAIVDALHIYNVADVVDREKPSHVRLGWSTDGLKAVLDINGFPHAVFDFDAQRGYCRTGFPEPSGEWSVGGHHWDDAALKLFD